MVVLIVDEAQFTRTNTRSLVGEWQGLPALAGGATQCADTSIGAAVDGADGRARHAARTAPHAVCSQFRVEHATLVATASDAFTAAHCEMTRIL